MFPYRIISIEKPYFAIFLVNQGDSTISYFMDLLRGLNSPVESFHRVRIFSKPSLWSAGKSG